MIASGARYICLINGKAAFVRVVSTVQLESHGGAGMRLVQRYTVRNEHTGKKSIVPASALKSPSGGVRLGT